MNDDAIADIIHECWLEHKALHPPKPPSPPPPMIEDNTPEEAERILGMVEL